MIGLEAEVIDAVKEVRVNEVKEIRRSPFDDRYKREHVRMLLRVKTLEDNLYTILATKSGYKVNLDVVRSYLT